MYIDSEKNLGQNVNVKFFAVAFFYTLFLPDGNKKNKKKSHEYLEATTNVACRGSTLEPWGHHGLGTWRTGGSL